MEEEEDVVVHLFSSLDSSMRERKKRRKKKNENAFTISEVLNKSRQKFQIKQSVCNYANAVLTPSMLLTLEGTFAR